MLGVSSSSGMLLRLRQLKPLGMLLPCTVCLPGVPRGRQDDMSWMLWLVTERLLNAVPCGASNKELSSACRQQ